MDPDPVARTGRGMGVATRILEPERRLVAEPPDHGAVLQAAPKLALTILMTSTMVQRPSPLRSPEPQGAVPSAWFVPSCTSTILTRPSAFRSQVAAARVCPAGAVCGSPYH